MRYAAIAILSATVGLLVATSLLVSRGDPLARPGGSPPPVTSLPSEDEQKVDDDTALAMRRFRDSKETLTSAATAYYQILQWNAVALQSAAMGGGAGDWEKAERRPPGIEESLSQLRLDGLADDVNRITGDPLLHADDKQRLVELWTLFADLKKLVENPRTYTYGKYDALTARFDRLVLNKAGHAAHS